MTNKSHHGELLEHAVRSRGISLTDLANELNVNRRTIYNWFESPFLKKAIMYRIGLTINHDFSAEFPQYFTSEDFSNDKVRHSNSLVANNQTTEWKDKYIDLLERYNLLLSDMSVPMR
ncbi:hypothetical protein IM792_00520 [Mucilaginibacter sp. JRF]|uniref:HTH domain-containing protein n=1 Tax=Mucilaginibacter sp. JRF TaxID=2780088 RepID=UPI001882AE3B|nr:HTH domain-containing protein [Mucilaginibacter sp. JRF]MBE9582919.1 hypothetical protein [Mucilaginibacter sp. JRF]